MKGGKSKHAYMECDIWIMLDEEAGPTSRVRNEINCVKRKHISSELSG